MRTFFHCLFPRWVDAPPQRTITDLERLEALIEEQRSAVYQANLTNIQASCDLGRAEQVLSDLVLLKYKIEYPVPKE